jgi:hypothetical protein
MEADSALRSSRRGACYRAHGWAARHFCFSGNEIGIPYSLAGQDTRLPWRVRVRVRACARVCVCAHVCIPEVLNVLF